MKKKNKWVSFKKALPKSGKPIYVKIDGVPCLETRWAWYANSLNDSVKPNPSITHWKYIFNI